MTCLAAIVYGLSSTNCLCSLALTINEPNSKLQTTNKPPGRKCTYKLLNQQDYISSSITKKIGIISFIVNMDHFIEKLLVRE